MTYSFLLKRSVILTLAVLMMGVSLAQAFLFDVKVMDRAAIVKLTDDKLLDAYIDVMIELEAVSTFYNNAGFTPKEYAKYKALLRFRTDLLIEIQKREMEVPRIK